MKARPPTTPPAIAPALDFDFDAGVESAPEPVLSVVVAVAGRAVPNSKDECDVSVA